MIASVGPAVVVAITALGKLPGVVEALAAIFGTSKEDVEAKLARAEAAVKDPIDVAPADAARREELERILRGEPTGSSR